MNLQGILHAELGFISFESPFDLFPERVTLLTPHRHHLTCACRPEAKLPLALVLQGSRRHVRRYRDMGDHSLDCVFHREFGRWNLEADTFSARILAPSTDANESAVTAFALMARAIFSRAYTKAFLENETGARLEDTARFAAEICSGIELLKPRQSLLCAAEFHGRTLAIGLVHDVVPPYQIGTDDTTWPVVIHAYHPGQGWQPKTKCTLGIAEVVVSALRRISIYARTIAGPYFAVALIEGGYVLRRLALVPVAIQSGQIASVDSDGERQMIYEFWRSKQLVYKPLRLRELNALHPRFRAAPGHDFIYHYRPDFIVVSAAIPAVWELAGFESSEDYELSFEKKAAYWTRLAREGAIKFRREGYARVLGRKRRKSSHGPEIEPMTAGAP